MVPLFVTPESIGSTSEKIISILALIFNVVALCGLLCIVLSVGADHTVGKSKNNIVERYIGIMTVVEKMWPSLLGFMFRTFFFGMFFVFMYGASVKQNIDDLTADGLVSYSLAIVRGLLLPILDGPQPIILGFISTLYFAFFARNSIKIFETNLSALNLQDENEESAVSVVAENKALFCALAAIPHLTLGLVITICGLFLPKGGFDKIISMTGSYDGNFSKLLIGTAIFCLVISAVIMFLAGFVAVIWMAAAERKGIINLTALADPSALSRMKPERQQSAQNLTLPGSSPVTRFGKKHS